MRFKINQVYHNTTKQIHFTAIFVLIVFSVGNFFLAAEQPKFKNRALLSELYEQFSGGVPRYSYDGPVFPEKIRPQLSRAYHKLLKQLPVEDLLTIFVQSLDVEIEITKDEEGECSLVYEAGPSIDPGPEVVFLAAVFQKAPGPAVQIVDMILKDDAHNRTCLFPDMLDKEYLPSHKIRWWPTPNRAAFYFLLLNTPEKDRDAHVEYVKEKTRDLLVLADIVLYKKVSPLVRDLYLKNGDWPHPDRLPEKERRFFVELRKRSEKRAAGRLLCGEYSEVPLFWFVGAWDDDRRTKLLLHMLLKSRFLVPSVYPYECLVEEERLEELMDLMTYGGIPGVYGAAGAIEVLCAKKRFDREMVLSQLQRTEKVEVAITDYVTTEPFGRAVLSFLGFEFGTPPVFQKFPEKWLSLCERSKGLSTRIRYLIALNYVKHQALMRPIQQMERVDRIIVSLFEEDSEVVSFTDAVDLLAAANTQFTFRWLQKKLPSLNADERLRALWALRLFPRNKVETILSEAKTLTENETTVLKEALHVAELREKSKAIVEQFKQKKLSPQSALKKLDAINHCTTLPYYWAIVKTLNQPLNKNIERSIQSYCKAVSELPDMTIDSSVRLFWTPEIWCVDDLLEKVVPQKARE